MPSSPNCHGDYAHALRKMVGKSSLDELFFSCFAQGLVDDRVRVILYPTAITIYNHYAQLRASSGVSRKRYSMADETMTDEQILEGVEHKSFVATSDRTAASLSASGVAAEDVARAAAQAAYDKKGEDVQVLDLTELSDVCDYFVLATGTNNRQVDSIVDEIEEKVAEACGEHPFSIEGREQKTWMLMDDAGCRPRLHSRSPRLLPPRKALG